MTFFLTMLCFLLTFSSGLQASPAGEGIQLYPSNARLTPEHKQNIADALSRYRTADNVWDILKDEFSLSHYESNPAVQNKIQWYMNNQDFLLRSASRAAPYLHYILQQVKKRHLPVELVLLPIVESGYNPFSQSNMGAAGIWQLMPQTATGLGIKQDLSYDGRRDVITSTRAALNYLAYLQSFFDGNWLLAIAAYNTGEGNVLAAIRRNIRDGRDTEFWSLPVAQETRDYVPSLLALATIISHPDQYPIYFPPVRNAPYLAQIEVGQQLNVKLAASLAGISSTRLLQLNPGLNRATTSMKGSYHLVLPIENVDQFTENRARTIYTAPINWVHYRVKSGDTLASIARRYKTTVLAISKMNHLSPGSNVHRGINLLIPYEGQIPLPSFDSDRVDEPILAENPPRIDKNRPNSRFSKAKASATIMTASASRPYSLQAGDTVYLVRKKDTLYSIAKRFNMTAHALQAANPSLKGKLAPGKSLLVPTHLASRSLKWPTETTKKKIISGDTLYMVRRGDTMYQIAKKFNTSPSAIRLANLIGGNHLTVGETIIIPTHKI